MVQWGTQSNVNLWNRPLLRSSPPSTIVEEDDTQVEDTQQKEEVDTTSLLPKCDRSRCMGPHTECMAGNNQEKCTKYLKHRNRDECTYRRFDYLCTWISKGGYIR